MEPTLGKNRTLSGVQFKPYTHGFDKPTPAAGRTGHRRPEPDRRVRCWVGLFDTGWPRTAARRELPRRAGRLVGPLRTGGQRLWWEGHATFIAGIIRRHAPSAVLDVRTALLRVPGGPARALDDAAVGLRRRLAELPGRRVAVLNLSVGRGHRDGRAPLVLERRDRPAHAEHGRRRRGREPRLARSPTRQRRRQACPRGARCSRPRSTTSRRRCLDGTVAGGRVHPRGAGARADTAPWIDVFAPGVETVSTYLGDGDPGEVLVRDADGPRTRRLRRLGVVVGHVVRRGRDHRRVGACSRRA
jgi:hypothetical protein